jgi:hypothetical protein
MRDDSGSFNVVSVDTRKSDQVPVPPVQIAPADKAAPQKAGPAQPPAPK